VTRKLIDVDAALYLHPFSEISGEDEFRREEPIDAKREAGRFKETLLVIRSSKLEQLLLDREGKALVGFALKHALEEAFDGRS
jgi:hypothetical protein